MALPVLLVVLMASVWVLACVAAQLRCVDAARVGARAAARGDAAAAVSAVARQVAPAGARVAVVRTGDHVTVVVSAEAKPFGAVLARLPATDVGARATAAVEER